MALSDEEKAQLDALNAKAEEASEDEDFDNEEIEVWNEKGAGARLRGRHSRAWLIENGFLKDRSTPPSDDSGNDNGDGGSGNGRKSKGTPKNPATRTSTKYFGAKK
jgi:hypothetical protein